MKALSVAARWGVRVLAVGLFLVWTTARHEGSHALTAWLEGAQLTAVKLLPGIHPEVGFYFGYTAYTGETSWLTDAAPFVIAALVAGLTALVANRWPLGRRRRAVVIFGLVSPLGDLAYGYLGGLWRPGTDVADLLAVLPPALVHVPFILAIVAGIVAMRRLHQPRDRRATTAG